MLLLGHVRSQCLSCVFGPAIGSVQKMFCRLSGNRESEAAAGMPARRCAQLAEMPARPFSAVRSQRDGAGRRACWMEVMGGQKHGEFRSMSTMKLPANHLARPLSA